MGIRVNKVIGYGSAQFSTDEDGFNDPRFDMQEGYQLSDDYVADQKADGNDARDLGRVDLSEEVLEQRVAEYKDALKDEHGEDSIRYLRIDYKLCLMSEEETEERCFWWNPKTVGVFTGGCEGPPTALVLVPPGHRDWFRHDDIMDYYEERGEDGISGRFTPMTDADGIWPYCCGWRRFRGEKQSDEEPDRLTGGDYNRLTGQWAADRPPVVSGDALTDLRENWRPVLPRLVIAWIFIQPWIKDKWGFANELRPCVYVYWD